MEVQAIRRVFYHKSKDLTLDDPNPNMTPEEVLDFYATQYPELNNGMIEDDALDGTIQRFNIKTTLGTKG
jgi:PRTRC genetic system protein C